MGDIKSGFTFEGGGVSAELIVDTIPDGLLVLDSGCRIQRWNRAMERLTGYGEAEVVGEACALLAFRDRLSGEILESERHCLREGRPDPQQIREMECTLQTRDGQTVPVRKYGRVLADRAGRAVGLLLILVDLRSLRALEDKLASVMPVEIDQHPPGRLVGTHPAMRTAYHRIRLAAQSDVTVLITGETGTGKELAAEAIHRLSVRRDKPLVRVNCSALSESLLESELFGHVKGAFTNAIKDTVGRIEMAEGGTLFLDELGDVSPLIQLKLLRVLQEHSYERVGEGTPRKANVRFIAATHRNLRELVEQGRFREDFFYRIRVFEVALPALRLHKSDIMLLCAACIERCNQRMGKAIRGVTPAARQSLLRYDWPGNVRQLENAIEHAFVTCQGREIDCDDLPVEVHMEVDLFGKTELERSDPVGRVVIARRRVNRALLLETLRASDGNRAEAARRLGIDRTTVWRMLKRWEIKLS